MKLNRNIVIGRLQSLKPLLRERFGVVRVAMFGSFARDEATDESDVDLLIGFDASARPTLFTLSDMDDVLNAHLGRKVDTVPEDSLNPRLAAYIRPDLIAV